jgi:hypothetical protein
MVKRHPERREEQPRIIQVACACDCVYGAWVHRCDQLPFASELGVPNPENAQGRDTRDFGGVPLVDVPTAPDRATTHTPARWNVTVAAFNDRDFDGWIK